MEYAPGTAVGRRTQLDQRLTAIRARLSELQHRDAPESLTISQWQQRIEAAQRRAATAQAAAIEQLACSAAALRRAAEAHDCVAAEHERAASSETSRSLEHKRQAAIHRDAAIHDCRRADQVQSLLSRAAHTGAPRSAALA